MKVLIVDDNKKNLKLFKLIVNSLGYETFTAIDGEEGVRIAKEKIPDLILTDIQMPVMDGIAALKELRSDKATKDIPVIALTSYAMKGDREKLLGQGFNEYIAKPIDKNNFIEVIQKILKKEDAI